MNNLSGFNIIIAKNQSELYKKAAQHFQKTLLHAVAKRGLALAVLSGGGTPLGLFQLLARTPYLEQIPWQSIHFFWADERYVPYDHHESSYGQAKRSLFDHIPVPAGNIHPVDTTLPVTEAAAHYQQEILKFGSPQNPITCFDWVLLGMGSDGHTASLFPGSSLASNEQDLIRPVQENYENRPAMRVTMTEQLLNQGREVLFLLKGQSKAEIVQRVLQGESDPSLYPAQRILPVAGNVTWLMDKEAASALK